MDSFSYPKPNYFFNPFLPFSPIEPSSLAKLPPSNTLKTQPKPSKKRDFQTLISEIPFLKPKSPKSHRIILDSRSVTLKKPQLLQKVPTFIDRRRLADFRIIGTAFNKIILLFDPFCLNIVAMDQHAIHERICYEIICSKLENQILGRPPPKDPPEESLLFLSEKKKDKILLFQDFFEKFAENAAEEEIRLEKVSALMEFQRFYQEFRNWGFDYRIDYGTGRLFEIRIPRLFGERISFSENYREFLDFFMSENQSYCKIPGAVDRIIMSKCCKNAIKFNEKLPRKKISILKDNLGKCQFPFVCIHGRTAMFPILSLR